MTAPTAPTLAIVNVAIGRVRITVSDTGADFYRIYRGAAINPTVLRLDDLDAGVTHDAVTEDTLYYYRAKAVNIIVVDDLPVEDPSGYGANKSIHTTNDSDVTKPDPSGALLANRGRIAGGG